MSGTGRVILSASCIYGIESYSESDECTNSLTLVSFSLPQCEEGSSKASDAVALWHEIGNPCGARLYRCNARDTGCVEWAIDLSQHWGMG
jgi:hypothetical protein